MRWLWRPTLLADMALLATLAVWFDGRQRDQTWQNELARRLANSERTSHDLRVELQRIQEAQQALQQRLDRLEEDLAAWQGQQQALSALIQEVTQSRDAWLLAEVEQALDLAAQQLAISGNVAAALIALESADQRLARSGQGHLLSLRKRINEDIARLRALPVADVPGIALKLDGLLTTIDTLPLAFERRPLSPRDAHPPASPSPMELGFWASLASELWRELRELIHIERLDRPAPALLAPEQSFFLRENLKLRLLAARLALLTRDSRSFRADIGQARQWLEHYFDRETRPVQAALATLGTLETTDLTLELPALRASFEALRTLKGGDALAEESTPSRRRTLPAHQTP